MEMRQAAWVAKAIQCNESIPVEQHGIACRWMTRPSDSSNVAGMVHKQMRRPAEAHCQTTTMHEKLQQARRSVLTHKGVSIARYSSLTLCAALAAAPRCIVHH